MRQLKSYLTLGVSKLCRRIPIMRQRYRQREEGLADVLRYHTYSFFHNLASPPLFIGAMTLEDMNRLEKEVNNGRSS